MNALKRLLLAIAAAGVVAPAAAQTTSYDSDAFVNAIRDGNGSEALKILDARPTLVNARDAKGKTALIAAIESREDQWVGYLLQHGADPNLPARDGDTPLIAASRIGAQEVASWLVTSGAKVDDTNRRGESALIVAVQQRHVPIVRMLLEAGADPDRPDSAAGYSARDYAKRNNRTPELLRLIEAKKPAS
jgi:ankyrin repeat protein